jgi:predicted dehydrogenase
MAFPHDYHLGVWRDFLVAIEAGSPSRISGAEALEVHRLIDALLEAGASGQKIEVR